MNRVRVLVVDDSVAIRRLVTQALASDPALEVVGVAANGRIGLARIPQLKPDIVTLDIEMPEMNGLEALVEIRRLYPHLPVIMLSSFTERGAAATLDALARGASDYLPKPASAQSVAAAVAFLQEQLVPRIKALTGLGGTPPPLPPPSRRGREVQAPAMLPPPHLRVRQRVDVVAIGVSTGGPNALVRVLGDLPANLPVPVLVVQHMPPVFTGMLAERLRTVCALDVREGVAGGVVEPGRVWIAPGDNHMVVQRSGTGVLLALQQEPPENSCRPAVDVLFRSLPGIWGGHVLALVMTGMGKDGLLGCEQIVKAGGQVLAQDQATSVVWGMPGFVAQAGLADAVLPLGDLGSEIISRVMAGRCGLKVPDRGGAQREPGEQR